MTVLRPATETDIAVLAPLWQEAWMAGHEAHVPAELTAQRTVESFAIRLKPLLEGTAVADRDGTVLGFCTLKGGELYQIMVSAEARGTGAAKLLMDDAFERQRARGYEAIWLDCAVGNERAAAFYRKTGWTLKETVIEPVETLGEPFPLKVWRFEYQL